MMINPILDPHGHKKQLEDMKNQAKIKPTKKKATGYRNNPAITITVTKKHADFLNDLAVELTIKYRKSFNNSEILRLIIEYAETFKEELPIFYEAKLRT